MTEQTFDKRRRVGAHFRRFSTQCLGRRVCIALVRLGHMFIDGDVARALRASDVAGDPFMINEGFDRPIGQPDIDPSSDQPMRH